MSTLLTESREPSQINAGDTVSWTRGFEAYPSGGDFTLAYTLINRVAKYDIAGDQVVGNDGDYAVTVASTVTASWAPGRYRWQAYITDGDGDRRTVAEGELRVLPNLQAQNSGFDDRTSAERTLDNIKELLETKSKEDSQMYEVHGRKNQRYTYAELEIEYENCKYRVREEHRLRGDRVSGRRVPVSFHG